MKLPRHFRKHASKSKTPPAKPVTHSTYRSSVKAISAKTRVIDPKLADGLPLSAMVAPCAADDCPRRKLLLPDIRRAQEVAGSWLVAQGSSDAVSALHLLALALVGGRASALNDPANFCRLLLMLCFDGHFAPAEDFAYTQQELSDWPMQKGWHEIMSRRLTRADAQRMLESQIDLAQACNRLDEAQFEAARLYFPQFKETEKVRCGDFAGNVTETHVTKTADSNVVCIFLLTQAQYRELQESVEMEAARVLRKALSYRGVRTDAEITRVKPPGDFAIEGLPFSVEHTKADQRPWEFLGKHGPGRRSYAKSESWSDLFQELDRAILKKVNKPTYTDDRRAKLILLLDSGILRLPEEVILAYKEARQEFFVKSRFREIWFVCGSSTEAYQLFGHNRPLA